MEMQRMTPKVLIAALALAGSAVVGSSAAFAAAATPTLALSGGSTVFGLSPAIIVATASTPGNVSFSVGSTVITGCASVATTTVTPFVAQCSWAPAAAGPATLNATLTPTDSVNFTVVNSAPFGVKVGTPVQGTTPSPISLYVDTIIASGSTGALAPRFGVSCAITSQFIVGQTIVFRVYGNDSDLGGAVLDSSNVASAYVTVAGMAAPIPLSYGNHSGVAFWSAPLKTGTTTGLYGTLGVVNFKVTVVTKDQSTIKVLSTKLQPRMLNGKRVRDSSGAQIYDRVSYYRTVPVTPALKGAVGVWQSSFTPTSQVTLYAVPTN
jgi:hypothetical protein